MPNRRSARRLAARLAVAAAACAAVAPAARAQPGAPTVERSAPFDSAGRVLVVTPALAARLRLAPPAFPVQGPFVDARLFTGPDAAAALPAVLSVTRVGGAVERYALAAADRAALAAAIAAGLAASGPGLRGDTTTVVSQPAGRAFVRNQTALGLLLYGPAAAVLVGSGDEAGTTLGYAAGAGAAFALSLAISQRQPVTRAQATLSGSMAVGGAAAASDALLALATPDESRAYAAAVLLGGVGGSVLGFHRAAGMTDAEASASSAAAFLGTATSVGVAVATNAYEDEGTGRAMVGANVAALAAGYALGPRYARTGRYHVTAGDVEILSPAGTTGALLGAALGSAFGGEGRRDGSYARAPWVGATAGLVAGTVLADRVLVRRRDHTSSEADLAGLGTTVGAALGLALAGSADANSGTGYLVAAGIGGLAGLGFSEALLKPAPDAGPRRLRTSLVRPLVRPLLQPGRLRVSPGGVALARLTAARGGRGTFPVLSLTF